MNPSAVNQSHPRSEATLLELLSPLGERLGEGVMQETIFALTPSPGLSPKGERNMR
jgi:hypothetical protein